MLPAGQFGWLWVGLQQIVETGIVVIVLRKLGVHSGLGVKMGSVRATRRLGRRQNGKSFHTRCADSFVWCVMARTDSVVMLT